MRAPPSLPAALQRAGSVLRRIVGAPDYERYVRHLRVHHPQIVPLTREEFMRQRLRDRYDRPGARCC